MEKSDFQIGELIESRYRVLAPIGAGGMGKLYRMADIGRDSAEVALKMVKLNLAGINAEEMLRKFQREFQLLTQLQHPNLVEVYKYGVTDAGDFYYTMEYIAGRDLAKGMQDLSLEYLLPIMVQICRALGYLHAREVMHGDLKPANVLLSGELVKLVDFGLAHDMRSEEEAQRYSTPFYAAPEVESGASMDGRADLYSLGAMLYQWIVGEAPTFMVGAERLIRLTLRERLASQAVIPPDIDSVVLRLLAQDPNQRYSSANQVIEAFNRVMGSAYELETRETASSYALRAPFLGRDDELDQLRDIWKKAGRGQAGLVLIGGESGVGKTRLVEELEVEVELSGARVVWGQCLESGGSAYQPWREVLRVLLRYVETAESLNLKRVGPVLAMIIPSLWDREYMAGLTPPAELEPQAARQRLNDAILQVLQAAAQTRPTLVVIDDAQWGDEASLELLRYLGRLLGNHGLLVCVTYRSDEVAEAVAEADADAQAHVLVELRGEPVQHVQLGALLEEDTQQLVRSMLGLEQLPAELEERVQGTTGGNTFFVQELIRSLAEQGQVLQRTVAGWQVDQVALQAAQLPGSIQQVVWRRLEQLSEEAQQTLRWAAVVGPVFWEGAIAQVGRVEGSLVRAGLSEGLERELVFERTESSFAGEREYLFAKPAMQEVSYESLPQEQRQESHARVADWLIGHGDEQVGEHLGLIAEHLQGAGQIEQAVIYLRRAGEQAAAQFANTQASSYFNRAFDLMPEEDYVARYDLLLAREKVSDLRGERQAQVDDLRLLLELAKVLDEALTSAVTLPKPPAGMRQTDIFLRQINFYEATGDYLAAIAKAQDVVRLAHIAKNVSREAAGYEKWGEALQRQGKYNEARLQLERALMLARSGGLRQEEADSLRGLGDICWRQGDYEGAKAYQQQALDLYRQLGNRRGENQALNSLGAANADQGNKEEGLAYFEQVLHISLQMGDRRSEALALNNLGTTYAHLGDQGGCRANYEQSLEVYRQIGDREGQARLLSNLGSLLSDLGNYATAKAYAQKAFKISREIGQLSISCLALCNMSSISHFLGDDQAAYEYARQAMRIAQEIGDRLVFGYALHNLAQALQSLGRLSEAVEAYQQAVTLHRELGQHFLAVESLTGLGHVSLIQGDLKKALEQVEEILRYLNQEGSTLDGTGEPILVYLTCFQVLDANQDPRAESILQSAYDLLTERTATIRDEGLRQSHLENVAAHREIIREFHRREPGKN